MNRFGLTTSAAAGLVVAAIIVSCSEAGSPSEAITQPDGGIGAVPASLASLAGGGWNPQVEAAASAAATANVDSGKVAICHSGNGKHYVTITVSSQARGHLGDPVTGRGGHAGDYRISALTECPPPTGVTGLVKICKVAGAGVTAGTNYSFTLASSGVANKTVTVAAGAAPAGTCVDAGSYKIGSTVQVTEASQTGVTTSGISVSPAGAQQGTSDLSGRTASVIAGTGATTLTFTNTSTVAATNGTLAICKVAGTGVTAGTNYTFTVAGQTATVAAGAAPAGTCTTTPLSVAAGNVTVVEGAATGVSLSSVTATGSGGANALVSSDLTARSASVTVAAGQLTTVTFTNTATAASTNGTLVICKIGGTGITAGTVYSFTAGTQTATVSAGAAPNGNCSAPLTVAAGALTVTETATAGTSVQAITGTPATPTNINLASRSATVQIAAGQETRITFTNVAP